VSPSPRLRVIETPPESAVSRLHHLVRQREGLRATFRDAWERVSTGMPERDVEAWAEGSLALAYVNAGPGCLLAFWRASVELKSRIGLDTLATLADSFADVCRHAGAEAALAGLQAMVAAVRAFNGNTSELALWARALRHLAREAQESVVALASRTETVLACLDGAGFESFVVAGLKAAGKNKAQRQAFFSLQDALPLQLLERGAGLPSFIEYERRLKLYATALWERPPTLRPILPVTGQPPPRRVNIAGGIVRVPLIYRGVPNETVPLLFRAAVAHATAHLALTPARFEIGKLKPLQITLIGLIEDARVEALAMRRFPGLRRLWAPFHVAEPSGVTTAPALLARLSRALFDSAYEDDDGFIAKARGLFAAEMTHLDDPELSRRVGGLLGNDLGQMRVQFNPRTYVIEPVYRDDNLGLWDFGEPPPNAEETIDLVVDAARPNETDDGNLSGEPEPDPGEVAGKAREKPAEDRGIVIASYPEWDRSVGIERPDWTIVRDVAPLPGDARAVEMALESAPAVVRRIARLVRGAKIGRHERLKRQPEGPELDLDAALAAAIALRTGDTPSDRIYRTMARRTRDLSVLILLDTSESTRDRIPSGASILGVQRLAVAALSDALAALGDPFALRAFASAGREDVRLTRLKDFNETYGAAAKARLAGLTPGLSTRLGAVLRHAGTEIAPVRTDRKLVLVLTDGEPSDIDVTDPLDLVEDARRAVLTLKARGIDVFGVTLDPKGVGSGAAVFGRTNHMPVRRLEELPQRLAELYFRLARR
jgi:nitric oxide reductase NorD protein